MGDSADPMEHIGSIIDRMVGKSLGMYLGGAERQLISNALRLLADRVQLGYTRSFELNWKEGMPLSGEEVVIPSKPIKFIKVVTVLGGEDELGRQE